MFDARRAVARLLRLPIAIAVFALAQSGCLAADLSIIHSPQEQGDVSPTSLVVSGNVLYGTTHQEMSGPTSVFKVNLDGTGYATVHEFEPDILNFDDATGQLVVVGNTIYGATAGGGSSQSGTMYSVHADGTDYQVLHNFGASTGDASGPQAGLTSDGSVLYGTTYQGGTAGQGAIFKINLDGSGYAILHSFAGDDGESPLEGLTITNGKLFGTTSQGGTGGSGTVYSIAEDGTGFTVLHGFGATDGYSASCKLIVDGNNVYGTLDGNVGSRDGVVYALALDGSGYRILHTFAIVGDVHASPGPNLALVNGAIYGTTSQGGTDDEGTVFKINPDGTRFSTLYNFSADAHYYPTGTLITNGVKIYGLTAMFSGPSTSYGTVFSINPDGSGYGAVHNFYGGDGVYADGDLIQQSNVLYGASYGGPNGLGALFKVNTDGTGFTILHALTAGEGQGPQGALTLSGTVFYGTTSTYDGSDATSNGAVFKVNLDGSGYTLLHVFNGTDGYKPSDHLAISGTTLYGVTQSGGTSNVGTVFAVNTDGTNFRVLHSFTNQEGDFPQNGLTLSGNALFGTTLYNTVFKINTDGTGFAILLGSSQGLGYLDSRLLIDGNALYGTSDGAIYKANLDGTGFQILHSFQNSDGRAPFSSLTRVGTTLYGTAQYGGDANGDGTLFSIQEDGTNFQVLYGYNQINGGPSGGNVTTDGTTFYGAASVVYRLTLLSGPTLAAQDTTINGFDDQSVLWVGSDNSMRVWSLAGGTFYLAGPTYGPYSDSSGAWHAKSVKAVYDGPSQVLWTRDDGAMGVWSLDQNGNETHIGPTYGPYSDTQGTWSALSLGVAADSTSRVLWKRSDGAVGLWTFAADDSVMAIGSVYGPYPGWTAQGFAVSADGSSRVLWNRTDGAAGAWTFSASGVEETVGPVYGPISDTHGAWTAAAVGVAGDGTARLLWKRADGAAGLWALDASDTLTAVGSVYGPYSDAGGTWAANALGVSLDGTSSVLWDRSDRAAGVWTFGANDLESVIGSVYGPF